jgi:hypothetical protein
MSMEVSLALLALSAPVTAAIIQWVRPSNQGVSRGEFAQFDRFVRGTLGNIQTDIRELRNRIDTRR